MIPAKVLVVEDELAIRRLLRAALERSGYAVVEAPTARAALSALDIDKPDLVLLDLGLPDRDGLELVQPLKRCGVALIVVSARDETADKVAALDLGADDYAVKPFDTEELLARIRTALRHRVAHSSEQSLVTSGDVAIDLVRRRVEKAGAEVRLARKEYAVLVELAKRPGRVLTHAHLLRAVWGPAHEADIAYLRVAIRGIRAKLDADAAEATLIRNEPGVGYRLMT